MTTSIASSLYLVECATCRATYDAGTAEFCRCLTNDPTFFCAHCANCFCSATAGVKAEFWKNAPADLATKWWRFRSSRRSASGGEGSSVPAWEGKPKVLIADDDPDVRAVASMIVEQLGYAALIATNGAEALRLAREQRPAIVITDALMPKLDGRELCLALKAEPGVQEIRVVLMTGLYRSRRQQQEALDDFKVDRFLVKPVDPMTLASTLEDLMAETYRIRAESGQDVGILDASPAG